MPTTSYGSWGTYAGVTSIEDTVNDFISGGGDEWIGRLVQTGAWDSIVDEYRAAINAHLSDGFTLNGDNFYGPANLDPDEADAARDMIRHMITVPDLGEIVARHDTDQPPAPTSRGDEESYDDVYGLTFPGRIPGAGDTR
jgi:hypothetical protein